MSEVFGLSAETFVEVSGLIDDVDAEIVELKAELYDFNGKQEVSTCIKLVLKQEGHEEVATEYYRVGKPNSVIPNEDGSGIIAAPGSKATGYNSSSKAAKFLDALGALVPTKGKTLPDFRGLVAHWDRKPFEFKGKREAGAKDLTILLPTKLVKAPGGSTAPLSGSSSGGGANAEAESLIKDTIVALGGSSTANAVGKELFKKHAKNPNLKAIVKLTMDQAWMSHDDRPWVVAADGTLQVMG